jgi:hypothetical protein
MLYKRCPGQKPEFVEIDCFDQAVEMEKAKGDANTIWLRLSERNLRLDEPADVPNDLLDVIQIVPLGRRRQRMGYDRAQHIYRPVTLTQLIRWGIHSKGNAYGDLNWDDYDHSRQDPMVATGS